MVTRTGGCAVALIVFVLGGCESSGSSTKKPDFDGSQDATTCDVIEGWAIDRAAPQVRQTVQILDGSAVLATIEASKRRDDLVTANIGDGSVAFSVATPTSMKDGKQHSISARITGTSAPLPHGPKSITCMQ